MLGPVPEQVLQGVVNTHFSQKVCVWCCWVGHVHGHDSSSSFYKMSITQRKKENPELNVRPGVDIRLNKHSSGLTEASTVHVGTVHVICYHGKQDDCIAGVQANKPPLPVSVIIMRMCGERVPRSGQRQECEGGADFQFTV
eukprot:scpid46880/ scgid18171/ 